MPDVNYNIVIKIDGEGKEGKTGKAVASTPSGKSVQGEGTQIVKAAKSVLHMAPVAFALSAARSVIHHEINKVDLKTGNSMLSKKINNQYSTISRTARIGGLLAMGAITQNPALYLAATFDFISWGIEEYQKSEMITLQQEISNAGSQMLRIRAGTSGNRSGKS